MPITQDRIIALVRAAEAYAEAFDTLRSLAERLLQDTPSPSREFTALYSAIALCEPKASDQVTIATERQRYDLTHLRNEKHRLRQRKRRKRSASTLHLAGVATGRMEGPSFVEEVSKEEETQPELHSDPDNFSPLDFEEQEG